LIFIHKGKNGITLSNVKMTKQGNKNIFYDQGETSVKYTNFSSDYHLKTSWISHCIFISINTL